MPRRVYHAKDTHREIQAMFLGALSPFGLKDEEGTHRVFRLKVNGSAIGVSRPRLHKPYSNYYAKEEFESLAVARMLVQLGMDERADNIIERDRPDIEVVLGDGESLYVEVRIIEDGQMRAGRYLEDGNHILAKNAERDLALKAALDRLNITLRVQQSLVSEISMHRLLKEVATYVKSIDKTQGNLEVPGDKYPILTNMGCHAFWRPKAYESRTILEADGEWFDQSYLSKAIIGSIDEKRSKADTYPEACKPLWLLLSITDSRLFSPFVDAEVDGALSGCPALDPFDRIVVVCSNMEPKWRDRRTE